MELYSRSTKKNSNNFGKNTSTVTSPLAVVISIVVRIALNLGSWFVYVDVWENSLLRVITFTKMKNNGAVYGLFNKNNSLNIG